MNLERKISIINIVVFVSVMSALFILMFADSYYTAKANNGIITPEEYSVIKGRLTTGMNIVMIISMIMMFTPLAFSSIMRIVIENRKNGLLIFTGPIYTPDPFRYVIEGSASILTVNLTKEYIEKLEESASFNSILKSVKHGINAFNIDYSDILKKDIKLQKIVEKENNDDDDESLTIDEQEDNVSEGYLYDDEFEEEGEEDKKEEKKKEIKDNPIPQLNTKEDKEKNSFHAKLKDLIWENKEEEEKRQQQYALKINKYYSNYFKDLYSKIYPQSPEDNDKQNLKLYYLPISTVENLDAISGENRLLTEEEKHDRLENLSGIFVLTDQDKFDFRFRYHPFEPSIRCKLSYIDWVLVDFPADPIALMIDKNLIQNKIRINETTVDQARLSAMGFLVHLVLASDNELRKKIAHLEAELKDTKVKLDETYDKLIEDMLSVGGFEKELQKRFTFNPFEVSTIVLSIVFFAIGILSGVLFF